MNAKSINALVISIFLLVFGFAVLVGQNIKPEQKSDSQEQINSGYITLNSGEILIVEKEPFSPSWNDWHNQLSICYSKWKRGTKFY